MVILGTDQRKRNPPLHQHLPRLPMREYRKLERHRRRNAKAREHRFLQTEGPELSTLYGFPVFHDTRMLFYVSTTLFSRFVSKFEVIGIMGMQCKLRRR